MILLEWLQSQTFCFVICISRNDEDDRTIRQVMNKKIHLLRYYSIAYHFSMWTKVFIYLIFNHTLNNIL